MIRQLLFAAVTFPVISWPAFSCSTTAKFLKIDSVCILSSAKSRQKMSISDSSQAKDFDVAKLTGARADVWLQARGVEFKVVEQTKATSKCRDSALERGISLRQIVKSMVFVEQTDHNPRTLQAMLPGRPFKQIRTKIMPI